MSTRIESDSIGSLAVPAEAYYGVQTLRAKRNFSISGKKLHPAFIKNMAKIKKAAAITNGSEGSLSPEIAQAIIRACDDVIEGKLQNEFIVDAVQGGAGTSANMNANEVIANRATERLGGVKGNYSIVHPNDHVNFCQSTNDVFPTAGKLTILELMPRLIGELARLESALDQKAVEFADVIKMGRTQLQDAVPTTLGRSFTAYRSAIQRDIHHLQNAMEELLTINLGATAIGNGINTTAEYFSAIAKNLSKEVNLPLKQADDLFDATQNIDVFVRVSGTAKTAAVNLSKISNDLRLLSSGPRAGLGEITLPSMQNGSSIMPGKVNPVIPEVVSQVAFQVIGNDLTITMAAESGQLELNAFEPIVFHSLFETMEMLTNAVATLTENCITGITANKEQCREHVEQSAGIATALCPYIGYKAASSIAKEALKTGSSVRRLVLEKGLLSEQEADTVLDLEKLAGAAQQLTRSSITASAVNG